MSKKSHKADLTILAVLGVVTALALLALMAAGWLGGGEEERDLSRSTQSVNVEGTVVAYTLFERLGCTVERSHRPLLDDSLDGAGVLVVISPRVSVNGAEVSTLDDWVRRGGVLLCTADVGLQLVSTHEGAQRYVPMALPAQGTARVPREKADLPLARDVTNVSFAGPLCLVTSNDASEPLSDAEGLFSDSMGLRIAGVPLGKGRVVLLSDSSFMANGRIGEGDNAVLAANLVAYSLSLAHGERVVFDEYHQGYGTYETGMSAMGAMLFHTRPGWAVLSLSAGGLLYLIYRGRRFGARRGVERSRRRSKMEYVNAVGATYRAAGAHGLALGIILRWFRGRAAEMVGLPASAPFADVAARLAQRTGRPAERYERAVRECEAALSGPAPSGRRVSALLDRLAQIDLEMRNERRTSN